MLNSSRLLINTGHVTCFSVTIQDKSTTRLDQSDEDDDNSSDYFADAETSSSVSFDDDVEWSEMTDNEGMFVLPKKAFSP